MNELTPETIQAISGLAEAASDPKTVDGGNIPYAIIPVGYELKPLGALIFNEHRATPQRAKQAVSVLDPESFIEYYTLFHDENSRTFADEQKLNVQSVLDYHGAAAGGGPRWGDHKLTLTLRHSEEWKIWTGKNNKPFTQMEFAEFLEQNSIDITSPSSASMIDLARDLEGKTEVEFGGGARTADGQIRFKYSETTRATVGSGQIEIPEQFIVTLPVFIGGTRIAMKAFFRYRLTQGKLSLYFTLMRPEEVMRQAFAAARDKIATDLSIKIINGSPA